MNEFIFFTHILVVFGFAFLALRMGKEALTAWIALQAVLANFFVLKQMTFFSLTITCSDPFAVGSILGLNLLREYYDPTTTRKALWICFISMLFFVVMSQVHLLYQPSSQDIAHSAYALLLSPAPRLLAASLATFFIVQRIDLYLFGLNQKWPFLLRNAFSLTLSQLLDTVLFTILGLWGLVTSLGEIMAISFIVKLTIIASSTPIIAFFGQHRKASL